MEVHSQIFVGVYGSYDHESEKKITKNKFWRNTPESAVEGGYSVLTAQAAGWLMGPVCSIWDVAAVAAIGLRAGFAIRSVSTGEEFKQFHANDFRNNWQMIDHKLLCANKNFAFISAAIKGEA
jgi:hypothetical protein